MSDSGIQVTGTGRAAAPPDVMVLDTGVEVTAADPGRAFAEAGESLADLRAAVLATGVPETDLRTGEVSLHPAHDRDGRVTGHRAVLGLQVTVRDFAASGTVIAAAAAGRNVRLGGVRLEHSDPAHLLAAARTAAVADARERAGELAGLLGRSLGRCQWVTEYGSAPAPRMMAARAMADSTMVVDGGEVEQVVTVETRWQFADESAD